MRSARTEAQTHIDVTSCYAGVLGREGDLAADGRAAEAVAVHEIPGHDTLDDPGCAGRRIAEAERVEERDWTAPIVKMSRRMPPTPWPRPGRAR